MIACDGGRALLLTVIPIAAFAGVLSVELLYVVAFSVGTLTTLFDVAHLAVLPELVAPNKLVEGNAKLETTRSLAFTAGLSLGGLLVQALTAPIAIFADVLSFVASAALIRSVRDDGRRLAPQPRRHLMREIGEGLSTTMRSPVLRSIVCANTCFNVGVSASYAVRLIFATEPADR